MPEPINGKKKKESRRINSGGILLYDYIFKLHITSAPRLVASMMMYMM